ncbi:MAG: prolyl oligopeptidase family serine peptidase, partial [Syntrophothermus sp.]
ALAGMESDALIWVEKAVRHGFTDYKFIRQDQDLNNIKDTPAFSRLLEDARQLMLKNFYNSAISLQKGYWNSFNLKSRYLFPKVNLSMGFDGDSLRILATVYDNHFIDQDRSWRYGDGFFITAAFPGQGDTVETDKFLSFGFSLENKKPVSVVVSRDGIYQLRGSNTASILLQVDSVKHKADYRISIPWSTLYPFNPLADSSAGINIIYISRNEDGSRKILKYFDDPNYDTEATNKRRFAPLYFRQSDKSGFQLSGELEKRLLTDNSAAVKLTVYAPAEFSARVLITVSDSTGKIISEKNYTEIFQAGKSTIYKNIDSPVSEGSYNISVMLNDTIKWKDSFYRLEAGTTGRFRKEISLIPSSGDKILINSIAAVGNYIEELDKMIASFDKRKDPFAVKNKVEKIRNLIKMCKVNKNIYCEPGYLQSAFLSVADSSLQPFSVYLPEGFDIRKEYNLICALHGSGVDESQTVISSGKEFCGRDNIVIGPRGRDLSSWYTGKSEDDAVNLIKTAKEIFRIKKTILYGFSMGGYGTWRISFLHPELFDGAIIVSGIPFNIKNNEPADNMNTHLGRAVNLPFLVIHGTEDHSLDIKHTDDFIEALRKRNYNVKYIRIPGAGHGNFKSSEMIKEWLGSNITKSN